MSCIHIHKGNWPRMTIWILSLEWRSGNWNLVNRTQISRTRRWRQTKMGHKVLINRTRSLQRRNGRIRRKRKKRNAKKKIRRKRVKSKVVSSLLFILLSYHHLLTICYHSFLFTAICTLRVMKCQCAKEAPLIRPRSEAGIDGERTMIRQQRHRCILCLFFSCKITRKLS